MNQALVLLAAGILLLVVYQNFFGDMKIKAPEKLTDGAPMAQADAQDMAQADMMNEQPIMPAMPSGPTQPHVGVDPEGEMPMLPDEATNVMSKPGVDEGGPDLLPVYGDFVQPTGNVYFKPHGEMGKAATVQNGIIKSSLASAGCNPHARCNRWYCEGCGGHPEAESCKKFGSDTDDIRRDYKGMITELRAKRNHEFPFYRLQGQA